MWEQSPSRVQLTAQLWPLNRDPGKSILLWEEVAAGLCGSISLPVSDFSVLKGILLATH